MASDSLFDEMEPRIQRPSLPFVPDRGLRIPPQVAEPSLYNQNFLPVSNEGFKPRVMISETSPVRSPGFIPHLTPLSSLKRSRFSEVSTPPTPSCGCQPNPTKADGVTSPSIDPEIKDLLQDQNRQLSLLQKQVEQLLQYQERLQGKLGEKEKTNGSTQTSYFDDQNHKSDPSPSPVRLFPHSNSSSPSMRQPQDRTEITLTFRDLQLETIVEQPPSPQPSFVVNMQEYQESVSEKSDQSEIDSCVNVMEHVQKLLAQANISEKRKVLLDKPPLDRVFNPNSAIDNPIRKVTMQRVQELGISFINPFTTNASRHPVYYPRDYVNKPNQMENRRETDQSVEMQRLAEKYLGLSKPVETKQAEYTCKNLRSVEMSMSSQQYLERYGLHDETGYVPR